MWTSCNVLFYFCDVMIALGSVYWSSELNAFDTQSAWAKKEKTNLTYNVKNFEKQTTLHKRTAW